jgi:hypothetical protein
MATVRTRRPKKIEYPESDGRPMGETPIHRVICFIRSGTKSA